MKIKIILLTVGVWLLSSCGKSQESTSTQSSSPGFTVKCEQQIPEFTLGPNSNPSEAEVSSLCDCIWAKLDGWEKKASIAIAEGKEKDLSAMHLRAFPHRFGGFIDDCGGMSL